MSGNSLCNQINSELQRASVNKESFGNILRLILGDFNQVSPVEDHSIDLSEFPFDSFDLLELSESVRQRNDPILGLALDHLSDGCCTSSHIEFFRSSNDCSDYWFPYLLNILEFIRDGCDCGVS